MAKSGGARPGAGRPVDPNSLRQAGKIDVNGWVTLPVKFDGEAPNWPLPDNEEPNLASRELQLWQALWMRPQAAQWQAQQMAYEVAIYVRLMVAGEVTGDTKPLAEARHRAAALGLTAAGMALLKWKLGTGEPEPDQGPTTRRKTGGGSASMRDRLKVVEGGTPV